MSNFWKIGKSEELLIDLRLLIESFYDKQKYDYEWKDIKKVREMMRKKNFSWKNFTKYSSISEDILYEIKNNLKKKHMTNVLDKDFNRKFSYDFLENFKQLIEWESYYYNNYIDLHIETKYLDKYFKKKTIRNPNINCDIIDKYIDTNKINWEDLTMYKLFSLENLYKYEKYLCWKYIGFQQNINLNLFERHIYEMNVEYFFGFGHDISIKFIDILFIYNMLNNIDIQLFTKKVITYTDCNKILLKYGEFIDWEYISVKTDIILSEDIYIKHANKINWILVAYNHNLSYKLIKSLNLYLRPFRNVLLFNKHKDVRNYCNLCNWIAVPFRFAGKTIKY